MRDLAELHGVTPTKKLGQNFVIDPNTVRKIVRLADVANGDVVLEIGPGLGSLTLGLTEVGAAVTAVEIDQRLAAQLPHTLAVMQPDHAHLLRVVRSDALEINREQVVHDGVEPSVLVANLPYNVSVPILMHVLQLLPSLAHGLVMVQSEVGHRIAARPGSKEYGAPSAKAAWYGTWQVVSQVSRNIFWPIPGVDSVLVSYQRYETSMASEHERTVTFALVNAAFAGRRKMLRQSLQGVVGIPSGAEHAAEVIAAAGIEPTARAEELSIAQYLTLARQLISDAETSATPRK